MPNINHTQYAILGQLSIQALSGYGIKKAIAESTHYFWSESYGNLYPSLQKLLKEKLIEILEPQQGKINKRPQINYQITAAGLDYLIAWVNKPHTTAAVRDELLLKLFFGKHGDKDDLLSHLEKEAQELSAENKLLKDLQKKIAEHHSTNGHAPYWLITLNCGIKHIAARLDWCKETINEIKKLK